MFSHIQPEILNRIFQTELFSRYGAESTLPTVTRTVKGLVFVQLYAVYEYTLTECFSAAARAISVHEIPASDIRPEILSVAFDPIFSSLSDITTQRSWPKRVEILEFSRGSSPVFLSDDLFPSDGSHFRPQQLSTVWSILGIKAPTLIDAVHEGRINEIVEHRNAIAHGREEASNIGSRFTVEEIKKRIDDMRAICLHIVETIEDHCMNADNLREVSEK